MPAPAGIWPASPSPCMELEQTDDYLDIGWQPATWLVGDTVFVADYEAFVSLPKSSTGLWMVSQSQAPASLLRSAECRHSEAYLMLQDALFRSVLVVRHPVNTQVHLAAMSVKTSSLSQGGMNCVMRTYYSSVSVT